MTFSIFSAVCINLAAATAQFPKVFVYDLQNNAGVIMRDATFCESKEVGSEDFYECLFGWKFDVKVDDETLTYRYTDQFRLARIIHARLALQNSHRTTNPDEADLFYVPIWRESFKPDMGKCPTTEKVKELLVYLNAETADRHFFISPRVGDTLHKEDLCDFMSEADKDELLSRTIRMALEDKMCCELNRSKYGAWGRVPFSIPYPPLGSGLTEPEFDKASRVAMNMSRKRPQLAMAALGLHGLATNLRGKWAQQCQDAHDCDLVNFKHDSFKGKENQLNTMKELTSSMLHAKFCLQPEGDTPSRKGVVDSIMLGCIPVFTESRQTRIWPWHIHNMAAFQVVVPESSYPDVIGFLRAIDEAKVRQYQKALAVAAQRLPYMLSEMSGSLAPFDSVEAMLAGAAASRPLNWKLQNGPTGAKQTCDNSDDLKECKGKEASFRIPFVITLVLLVGSLGYYEFTLRPKLRHALARHETELVENRS